MNQPPTVNDLHRRFLPTEIQGFDRLAELALDMHWSWNHATDKLWRQLDRTLWELTQNPWVVLQTVARDKLEEALSDPGFRQSIEALLSERRAAETRPAWFQRLYPESPLGCVAYFSMEFMLSEEMPIYSGGLGNVVGIGAGQDYSVALTSAGAYGFAMASNYNSRPLPAEVMVEGGSSRIVRYRQDLDALIEGES